MVKKSRRNFQTILFYHITTTYLNYAGVGLQAALAQLVQIVNHVEIRPVNLESQLCWWGCQEIDENEKKKSEVDAYLYLTLVASGLT